jgi:hypothetical protein
MRVGVQKLYGENLSIFKMLYDAVQVVELKKLRFAKCDECGRLTPYRLQSTFGNVQCKRCGISIYIENIETKMARS